MKQPENNGLFEVAGGKKQKKRGFNCMQLIIFLTEDDVTEWDDWHGAHEQAKAGHCTYKGKCHIYARSIEKIKKKSIQPTLF
ncbi:MAG: hypothetical protein J6A00_08395 [Bacteroides sp.]|nr:hypothetical protein [Bacteroides sp.]